MANNLWKVKQPVLNPFTATFLTGPVMGPDGTNFENGAYVFSQDGKAVFMGKEEFESAHETARAPQVKKTPEERAAAKQAREDKKAAKAAAGASGVKPGRPAKASAK